jgi:hypothetical protein
MAKISHAKIKQPSFGEKRPKLTYTKISGFTVFHIRAVHYFCQLIQNVNGSVLISTSDTTFLLLLTGYFDVVLKTK